MTRVGLVTLLFAALATPMHFATAESAASAWGCAPMGERRNVLYLYDQGSRSYVKFGQQRVPATHSADDKERRWSWGANAITLDAENIARYLEAGNLKAQFKCKVRASR